MSSHRYRFTAPVEMLDFGKMAYAVVYAPTDVADQLELPKTPRLRIAGEVCGEAFEGAFQPSGAGEYYLLLAKKFCKQAKLAVGDQADVSFEIADQDAVAVPRELQFALNAKEDANRIWNTLTPGKRRGLAYRVASAKRASTIETRVEEVIDALLQLQESNKT
ncbi:MAG: YdeI/OmpD-associated family protein [Planctomycetota bacterium]